MAITLFIASVILPGLALISFWYPRWVRGWQILALAYGAGSALLTFELFLYFVIFRGSDGAFLPYFFAIQTGLLLAVAAWRFPWKSQIVPGAMPQRAWIGGVAALGVAVLLFLSLVQGLAKPPAAFDSVSFWGTRARILLAQGKVDFNPDSATYLSAPASRNYPWHLSLLEYWSLRLGAVGGEVHLIAWLSYFSLCLLLADFSVRRIGWNKGLCLTFLFAAQPLLFYHASNNYADLTAAYFAAVGFAFFLEWLEGKRLAFLILAAAWTGWTFSLKNYGVFYILILLMGLGLAWYLKEWKPDWKKTWPVALALALPIAPIGLFKVLFRLNLRNSEAAWVWHPEALQGFVGAFFVDASWNIWWTVLVVVFFSMVPLIWRNKRLFIAWAMYVGLIVIMLLVFTVTENYRWALDRTVISRAFLPLLALSAFLIAFTFGQYSSSMYDKSASRL